MGSGHAGMLEAVMFKIRKSKREWSTYLQKTQGGGMVHDTDKPELKTDEAGQQMKTITMGFNCPLGFEPVAFIITAMDAKGNPFTNAPAQPNLALHLARLAIDFATERAVRFMQGEMKKPPSIITAPAGSIPPWEGPAGRG